VLVVLWINYILLVGTDIARLLIQKEVKNNLLIYYILEKGVKKMFYYYTIKFILSGIYMRFMLNTGYGK